MSARTRLLRVLHAPVNYANQAYLLSRTLRQQGVDSVQWRYRFEGEGAQFYDDDERVVEVTNRDWYGDMLRTVQQVASEGFDIIHLWNRTLLHWRPGDIMNGTDLPYLRLSGARLAFRFTGYDLRRKSLEMKVNRYSPHHYGFRSPYLEDDQQRYIESIAPYIGQFVVQDPEMLSYLPTAHVIPRAIDLDQFPISSQPSSERPLVVHAPSNKELKGSDFVLKAVEQLQSEGVHFDFRLVEDLPNAEALALYRRSDIVIDQLLIGWYGVLAMEGMAMGKAVIAYIRDDLLDYFQNGMPLLNANPDNITSVLREAIKDGELRREVGLRARRFVEEMHDSRTVATAATQMYDRMLEAPAERIIPDFVYQLHSSADFRERFEGARLAWSQREVALLREQDKARVTRIAELEKTEKQQTVRIAQLEAEMRAMTAPGDGYLTPGSKESAPLSGAASMAATATVAKQSAVLLTRNVASAARDVAAAKLGVPSLVTVLSLETKDADNKGNFFASLHAPAQRFDRVVMGASLAPFHPAFLAALADAAIVRLTSTGPSNGNVSNRLAAWMMASLGEQSPFGIAGFETLLVGSAAEAKSLQDLISHLPLPDRPLSIVDRGTRIGLCPCLLALGGALPIRQIVATETIPSLAGVARELIRHLQLEDQLQLEVGRNVDFRYVEPPDIIFFINFLRRIPSPDVRKATFQAAWQALPGDGIIIVREAQLSVTEVQNALELPARFTIYGVEQGAVRAYPTEPSASAAQRPEPYYLVISK